MEEEEGWFEYTQSLDISQVTGAGWPLYSTSFDLYQEVLYTGDASGKVSSYTLGARNEPLDKYSSFVCSQTPIRKIHSDGERGIITQSDDTIQLRTRGGRRLFSRATTPNDLFTASAINSTYKNQVIVATASGAATVLNLDSGVVQKRMAINSAPNAIFLEATKLTIGTIAGTIAVRDPRTGFSVVQSTEAFGSSVVDIAVEEDGHRIFACGTVNGGKEVDYRIENECVIKIFDARKLSESPLGIIQCDGAPIRLVSTGTDLWTCYDSGFVETRPLDRLLGDCAPEWDFEPALGEYAFCTDLAVSPSGQVAAVADTDGVLHVWTNSAYDDDPVIGHEYVFPEFPSHTDGPQPFASVLVTDEAFSLSNIPMDVPQSPLLSAMNPDKLYDVGKPVAGLINPAVLDNLKQMGSVGYAPNPRTHRRNQDQFFSGNWRRKWKDGTIMTLNDNEDDELTMGKSKFISQQRRCGQSPGQPLDGARTMSGDGSGSRASLAQQSPSTTHSPPNSRAMTPIGMSPSVGQQQYQMDQTGEGTVDLVMQQSANAKGPPTFLQQVKIEYSRFGVEDFDFSLYNSTPWSGLEANISNAYANSLLQALFFIAPLKSLVQAHLTRAKCSDSDCVTCQLALLFRMLETAEGQSCHASMFLQALEERTEAIALGLLEQPQGGSAADGGCSHSVLIQRLFRYLLERINSDAADVACKPKQLDDEGKKSSAGPKKHKEDIEERIAERMMGFELTTDSACSICKETQTRHSSIFALDLDPPHGSSDLATLLAGGTASVERVRRKKVLHESSIGSNGRTIDFADVLGRSLRKVETTRAWCQKCRKFQLLNTTKFMNDLPNGYLAIGFPREFSAVSTAAIQPLLSVSSSSSLDILVQKPPIGVQQTSSAGASQETMRFMLPNSITLTKDESGVRLGEEDDGVRYEAVSVISSIKDSSRGPEHLVVHVRNPHNPGEWILLNDFLVKIVGADAALSFVDSWRTPSLAFYARVDKDHNPAFEADAEMREILRKFSYAISPTILTSPRSVLDKPTSGRHHRNGQAMRNMAVPLTKNESQRLGSSFKCAIDAEFVVLEAAEREVFSDGTQEVHRPPIHALARLSIVRANADMPMYGVPFIDDYVATNRPISDLVTQYSGIHCGDLNPKTSSHKLSTRKEVYLKLRLLVDKGCVFIGHGLKHDFRVCNIIVSERQMLDTMVLFTSDKFMRPVALRFLYWYFVGKNIQEGEHSSVVDAKATLRVYKEIVEAKNKGEFKALIENVHSLGQAVAWKIPVTKPAMK